jgi:hypothetical protein
MFNARFQLQEKQYGSPKLLPSILAGTSTLLDPPDLYRTDWQKTSGIYRPQANRARGVGDHNEGTATASTLSALRPSGTASRGMVRMPQPL